MAEFGVHKTCLSCDHSRRDLSVQAGRRGVCPECGNEVDFEAPADMTMPKLVIGLPYGLVIFELMFRAAASRITTGRWPSFFGTASPLVDWAVGNPIELSVLVLLILLVAGSIGGMVAAIFASFKGKITRPVSEGRAGVFSLGCLTILFINAGYVMRVLSIAVDQGMNW